MKYKLECTEKEFAIKEKDWQDQIAMLNRDKSRMDELINLKDKELQSVNKELLESLEKLKSAEK